MFQANYKDARKHNLKHSSAFWLSTLNMFLFARVLPQARNYSIEILKNNSTKNEFSRKYMSQFLQYLHAKADFCFVHGSSLKFYGKGLQHRSYSSKVNMLKYMPKLWYRYQNYISCSNSGSFIAKFENAFVCSGYFQSQNQDKLLKTSEFFKRNTCGRVSL